MGDADVQGGALFLRSVAMEQVDHDEEFFLELLGDTMSDVDDNFGALRDAVAATGPTSITSITNRAHAIKGICAMMGLERLRRRASDLELLSKACAQAEDSEPQKKRQRTDVAADVPGRGDLTRAFENVEHVLRQTKSRLAAEGLPCGSQVEEGLDSRGTGRGVEDGVEEGAEEGAEERGASGTDGAMPSARNAGESEGSAEAGDSGDSGEAVGVAQA